MNRADFMGQLESLLQSIAPTEREEAIQYYNDYFDDAGRENEQEVIEALGNPARVAENIKRDLLGSGYGEKAARKAQASDRALIEYGQELEGDTGSGREEQNGAPAPGQNPQEAAPEPGRGEAGHGPGAAGGFGQGMKGASAASGPDRKQPSDFQSEGEQAQQEAPRRDWNPFDGYGRTSQDYTADQDDYRWSHDTAGWSQGTSGKPGKPGMPVWAIAMLVTVLVLASPVLLGVVSVVFGLLMGWFGTILGFGVAAVCLLLVFVVLVVVGIICSVTNPWVGMAMVGAGLICGCMGILFLMLTVAMAGIATPAICRGIAGLFRSIKKKTARMARA